MSYVNIDLLAMNFILMSRPQGPQLNLAGGLP